MRKNTGRKVARRTARARDERWRRRGSNPRCRWSGTNLTELAAFVVEHGGRLDTVGIAGRSPILVVQPVALAVHPGRWVERVVERAADDPRGWRTFVM